MSADIDTTFWGTALVSSVALKLSTVVDKKSLKGGFANGGSLFWEMDLLSSIYHRYAWALLQEMPVRAQGPGPAGPLASPEAMPMHIDDISTIASPFPKKVNPHLQSPL